MPRLSSSEDELSDDELPGRVYDMISLHGKEVNIV